MEKKRVKLIKFNLSKSKSSTSKSNGQKETMSEDKPTGYVWADIAPSDIVRVSSPSGHSADFLKAGDMHFPVVMKNDGLMPDPRLNIDRIKRMKARDDDVLICAYLKAGTHWTWEITQMLLSGSTEYSEKGKETGYLEFHIPDEFDDTPSPRMFNTHLEFHNLPVEMIEKKCKIIYVQRNPKDVAVSMYNFFKSGFGEEYAGSWNDFFHMFFEDVQMHMNWFRSTLSWEKVLEDKDQNILPVYYEDLKQDPVSEITRIAKFLNVDYSDNLIQEIAERCHFKTMKQATKEARKEEMENLAKSSDGKISVEEATEQVSDIMYRKGDVGDWQNWFTVDQSVQFDGIYAERMKNSKLKFKYVL